MQIDPAFIPELNGLDLESMASSLDTIYIIDPDFRLRAFNPSWITFARDNNGLEMLAQYPLGGRIDQAFPDVVKKYYVDAYNNALATHRVFEHDYECSSADRFRLLHQTAYPLRQGNGLVISNHLVRETTHSDTPLEFSLRMADGHGNIIQCCHCRKIKDPSYGQSWFWVPSLVRASRPNTSHAICPRCLDFYYR